MGRLKRRKTTVSVIYTSDADRMLWGRTSMMQMVCPLTILSPSFTKLGSPGAGDLYNVPDIGDTTSTPRTDTAGAGAAATGVAALGAAAGASATGAGALAICIPAL